MSLRNYLRLSGVPLAFAFALAMPVQAQDEGVNEVIVTGSYIKQSPEDAAVPIDVVNSEELFSVGNPSIVELIKTLGVSSGVDGETNQFQSNGLEGTANINLRGLGAGRNLVLLNGRRNVFSPYAIAEQQQLFVDINMIPAVALDRIELLKDGAAATYGSDAISGVVNFITRSDFEGLEVALSHKAIDGSDGDQNFGVIWGHDFGATHWTVAGGYNVRNELPARERDWTIEPRLSMGNYRGYTGIPNPGAFFPVTSGAITGAGIVDPRCADFVGDASAAAAVSPHCTYNYVYFDNLIEEETRINLFSELTHEFSDDLSLNIELLYGQNEVPEWKSSPSYPPQTLTDTSPITGRFVPSYHPGLIEAARKYPSLFGQYGDANCSVTSRTDTSCDALLFFGRPRGVSGPPQVGSREYETTRIVVGLEGAFTDDIDFTTSLLWSTTEAERVTQDTIAENWAQALRGFGGADCTGNTPGKNGCRFYNPFSNAIDVPQSKTAKIASNPDYKADLANPLSLRDWMTEGVGAAAETELTVFDAVVSGEFSNIGWAAGLQAREEAYTSTPFDGSNLLVNPCQSAGESSRWRQRSGGNLSVKCDAGTISDTSDDYEGSGRFIFLAGATPFDENQTIGAVFGELRIPLTADLEVQLSARHEDYGGEVGASTDPKLAVRWQASDGLTLRGSASTTFRGPTLNQLGGRITSLSYVTPTGSFKAVDTSGNPDLDPEKADTLNFGILYDVDGLIGESDNFNFSVDYWSLAFQDPIIRESFGDLIRLAFNGTDKDATLNSASPYASRFTLGSGSKASAIQRIRVNMVNGPDIDTDGIDLAINYGFDLGTGQLGFNLQMTRINSFEVAASVLNAEIDALNKLNDTVDYLRPIVSDKGKLGIKYETQIHTVNLVANQTGAYDDAGGTREVEEHITYDLHYNYVVAEESALWISGYNVTDEDPPYARLDLNYDPYTHNPFGRIIKVGVRHKF